MRFRIAEITVASRVTQTRSYLASNYFLSLSRVQVFLRLVMGILTYHFILSYRNRICPILVYEFLLYYF